MNDFAHITRVHVVTPGNEPNKEYWADSWVVALQDEGATLKLFATGDGKRAQQIRDEALAGDLSRDYRWWRKVRRHK